MPCLAMTSLVGFIFFLRHCPSSPSYSFTFSWGRLSLPVLRAGCLVHSIYHRPNDEDEDGDEEEEEDRDDEAQPRPLIDRVIVCLGVGWLLPTSSPLPSLFCQLQMIFKTTAAKENVGVTRVVIALADNLAKFSFINILLVIALADNLNLAEP